MSNSEKYSASFFLFWIFQLFRVLPRSAKQHFLKHAKVITWFFMLFPATLLLFLFQISATGSHLYESPDVDLLFGIFFKDILIPMIFLMVAWYIIALKHLPERNDEYFFLNSLPVSNQIICIHFILLDIFRFCWIPGSLILLYFGLQSFTPLAFLIRLDILTGLVFVLSVTGNICLQLFFFSRSKNKGGFGYPAKMHPMILFCVILFFTFMQLSWIVSPQLNIGVPFWVIVSGLITLIFLCFIISYSVFKQWQITNAGFKFEGSKKSVGKLNYLVAAKVSRILPFLKSNPFFLKNLVKISMEKRSLANGILTSVFILISYLIAMNNENFADSISVLLGIYGIYSFVFAIRTMYHVDFESESPNLIYALPIKKHQFYVSVFALSFLWLMIVFSILTVFLLFSGSGLPNAFGFWWRALFLSLVFLSIALNFAFSSYPEMKIAQKRFFYYLMFVTIVTVSFYKFRYGVLVAFTLISFLQLFRLKLFRLP